jgi:hypothetical protein
VIEGSQAFSFLVCSAVFFLVQFWGYHCWSQVGKVMHACTLAFISEGLGIGLE